MPGTMTADSEKSPSVQATFEDALAKLPDGYVGGYFGNRSWGVTVKRSQDGKRTWLYGEELGGNRYRQLQPLSLGLSWADTEAVRNVLHQGDRIRSRFPQPISRASGRCAPTRRPMASAMTRSTISSKASRSARSPADASPPPIGRPLTSALCRWCQRAPTIARARDSYGRDPVYGLTGSPVRPDEAR